MLAREESAPFRDRQMPTLRQLLAAHAPLLVIDAASARVQVGLLEAEGRSQWRAQEDEAGVAVFTGVEQLGVDLARVGGFVFCEGPGSVLGVRTVAMALRTWGVLAPRPMFAYVSLAVVAHALGRNEVAVIADARRDAWHHYQIGRGLRRVPAADLRGDAELVMPEHFRSWAPVPANVQRVPYSLEELLPRVCNVELFRATNEPDAFLHEEPSYVTWTPQIHRAPGER
jgi:tRNA threonylcarbamoyladenosine biosynthesis protein TsaB